MTPPVRPASPEELRDILKEATLRHESVTIVGNGSKRAMAGPIQPSGVVVSTAALRRVLHYEKHDLTISVESGMPFGELQALLARNGQMIALDPPFAAQATVGGVVASNTSGPLRCGFGTARDLIIGMSFVTVEGKCVKTGGMVVKNVAGLDMGKLMIGSFGTLAVISSVNFRVHSLPPETRTFLFTFSDPEAAIEQRDVITRGVLRPIALDLISPVAAARLDLTGYVLAVRAGGSRTVLERYARDLPGSQLLPEADESTFWRKVQEFTPDFLRRQPSGVVVRINTSATDLIPLLKLVSGAFIVRASSGVTYAYLSSWQSMPALRTALATRNWSAVVDFAPDEVRHTEQLWLEPSLPGVSDTFDIMRKVKQTFDPAMRLNQSRLYGRI